MDLKKNIININKIKLGNMDQKKKYDISNKKK